MEAHEEWNVFSGIADRPVFPVREGRMAMLVSRLDAGFVPRAQSIVEHSRAVHRVFDRHTVLPFRFGTSFENEDQVRRVLLANRTKFQDAMNRLRNMAEMHVKLLFSGPAGPEQALLERARKLLGDIFPAAEEQISLRLLRNGDCMVDFAHLVERAGSDAYRQAYTRAAEHIAECQVLISGPWPPYHFMPPAIRIPAGSERTMLRPGRRAVRRAAAPQYTVPEPVVARAVKA